MKTQFIIEEQCEEKRRYFYNYIHEKYNLEDKMSSKYMIGSKYPFVVDLKEKTLWVCTSITCLACTKGITINKFIEGKY